jgi:hypothetical protein
MSTPARRPHAVLALAVLLSLLASVAGCGSGGAAARAEDPAQVKPAAGQCPQTVLATLGSVLQRVYGEGIDSERTASARHMIERSPQLRVAIERGDPVAARAAARELLATGHMTNLEVRAGGRTLVSVGGPALAPLHGTIAGAGGRPPATYTTSVWADHGFASEASGVAEGLLAIRSGGRSVGGTLDLPEGQLPAQGSLTRRGVVYQYTSFTAQAYPSGSVQIYLLKPLDAVLRLCGSSDLETQVQTLSRVANLIYEGEGGTRTQVQIRRVQAYGPLLSAVAARDAVATRAAVAALLHHHIVRLRVSAGATLLSDDGGPFVLAPVRAELRLHGRRIGSFVLSIQDDEGYLRLAGRLAGLKVLMYMRAPGGGRRLVKNSLGPAPGQVPPSGPYTYRGRSFRVFTVNAVAFPSGPLTIRVLVPIPYS